ncbi:carboxypeptidase regulatory-like domain-containing protein, partial [Acidobacteriota bacterium]
MGVNMHKACGKLCLLIALLLSLTLLCNAQSQTGSISGSVTDTEGVPLPGVTVSADSPSLQGVRSVISDNKGNYKLPLLPIGKYSITFELDGFEKLILTGYEVRTGFTVVIEAEMNASAIDEEVIVTADTPLIDKTKADNSYRLNADELVNIPTQGRTIEEVVTYTPGVTGVRASTISGTDQGLPSFRGQGEEGNTWIVDGLSINGARIDAPAIEVNLDSWDEIEIISDGFEPDLNQTPGAVINIITKSGGNTLHGEVGILARDWHLRADRSPQLSVASVPNTSIHQLIGNLGGPIIKDKLWFFVSNNFHRTLDESGQESVGWLTIPSGQRSLNTNNIFGKLSFSPRPNHTVTFTGIYDTFLSQSGGIGLPETYTKDDYTDYTYRLNYRGILSQKTFITAAIGQYEQDSQLRIASGNYGPPSYTWLDIGQITNNAQQGIAEINGRTEFSANITHFLDLGGWADHEVKAGIFAYTKRSQRTNHIAGSDFDLWPGNGFDSGVRVFWMEPGIPFSLEEHGYVERDNKSGGIGFYLQDRFQIDRFSVMIGLRSETQTLYDDLGNELWSWGLGDFLSPRISFAIDLLKNGENIIKFGYGQFANPMSNMGLIAFNSKQGVEFRNYGWVGGINPN